VLSLGLLGELLLQSVATQSGDVGSRSLLAWMNVGARRRSRRSDYGALIAVTTRAYLRIRFLMTLQSAAVSKPFSAAAWSGSGVLAASLERVLVDLSDVIAAWRQVRAVAPVEVAERADDVVSALAELMLDPDPGLFKPLRQRAAKARRETAEERYQLTLRAFTLADTADAAPRRRDRRSAEAELRELPAPPLLRSVRSATTIQPGSGTRRARRL
jgi:hypothetical protein